MMKAEVRILFFLCFMMVACSSSDSRTGEARRSIAVTTSYLECTARDLAGNDIAFVRLVPPGMCPGHFDIAPGIVKSLKKSSLLLRFDFQDSLDRKVRSLVGKDFPIKAITAPEGLCVPESYRRCVQELHKEFCIRFPDKKGEFDRAMDKVIRELESLEKECRTKIKEHNLEAEKVIISGHQEVFCRWLGLDVVASYSGANATSPRQLLDIIEKGRDSHVRYVIANLQEGGQEGEALAAHLGAKMVTFSNFPNMGKGQESFYDLVRWNLENLIQAGKEKEP
jgi:ABC-type Zn uptake system ZnuABC Zn-binding protein ZnuA